MLCTIERLTLINEPLSLFLGTNVQESFWFIVNKNAFSRSLITFTVLNLIVNF